jgi:hypothetical protein
MSPYRIPADPEVERGIGAGVFAPTPELLDPETVPDAAAALRAVRAAAAHEYLRHLVRLRAQRLDPPAP